MDEDLQRQVTTLFEEISHELVKRDITRKWLDDKHRLLKSGELTDEECIAILETLHSFYIWYQKNNGPLNCAMTDDLFQGVCFEEFLKFERVNAKISENILSDDDFRTAYEEIICFPNGIQRTDINKDFFDRGFFKNLKLKDLLDRVVKGIAGGILIVGDVTAINAAPTPFVILNGMVSVYLGADSMHTAYKGNKEESENRPLKG